MSRDASWIWFIDTKIIFSLNSSIPDVPPGELSIIQVSKLEITFSHHDHAHLIIRTENPDVSYKGNFMIKWRR